MLTTLRWVLLISALLNLLATTGFYRPVGRPLMTAWLSFFGRNSAMPDWLRDDRVLRGWALGSAALTLLLWWYLGTPSGAAAATDFFRQIRGAA